MDPNQVVVHGLDGTERLDFRREVGALRRQQPVPRGLHRRGIERSAVGELHALLQRELDGRRVGSRPLGRESRRDVPSGSVVDHVVVDQIPDLAGRRARGHRHGRVEQHPAAAGEVVAVAQYRRLVDLLRCGGRAGRERRNGGESHRRDRHNTPTTRSLSSTSNAVEHPIPLDRHYQPTPRRPDSILCGRTRRSTRPRCRMSFVLMRGSGARPDSIQRPRARCHGDRGRMALPLHSCATE